MAKPIEEQKSGTALKHQGQIYFFRQFNRNKINNLSSDQTGNYIN